VNATPSSAAANIAPPSLFVPFYDEEEMISQFFDSMVRVARIDSRRDLRNRP
jgi:hypothetical protein